MKPELYVGESLEKIGKDDTLRELRGQQGKRRRDDMDLRQVSALCGLTLLRGPAADEAPPPPPTTRLQETPGTRGFPNN
ncbi:hypothetical protein NQZ68_008876 [Dissostichus eleginoides]|nr:hypothetical protein NQZ68_008876 [Dissostichus eleginoides]